MNPAAVPRYQPGVTVIALWRYEVRRAGWAAPLSPLMCAALLLVLAAFQEGDSATARLLFGVLEVAIPLAAGVVAASLVGRDPAVELQLSVVRGYRTTLLRRLTIGFGWAAALALVVAVALAVSGWWYRLPAAPNPVAGQLVWLAPTLWLSGFGFLLGALLRNPAAAGGMVAGMWTVSLVFSTAFESHALLRPLYLFTTTLAVVDDTWLANRLVLLATGAAMLTVGWLLLARTERLLTGEDA